MKISYHAINVLKVSLSESARRKSGRDEKDLQFKTCRRDGWVARLLALDPSHVF